MTEFARSSAVAHLEARRSSQENSCYRAHTHDAFSVGFIESGASNFAGMTTGPVRLEPGDVISMGTPGGIGSAHHPPRLLRDGDVVECAIDALGAQRNSVALSDG